MKVWDMNCSFIAYGLWESPAC